MTVSRRIDLFRKFLAVLLLIFGLLSNSSCVNSTANLGEPARPSAEDEELVGYARDPYVEILVPEQNQKVFQYFQAYKGNCASGMPLDIVYPEGASGPSLKSSCKRRQSRTSSISSGILNDSHLRCEPWVQTTRLRGAGSPTRGPS